MKRRTKVSRSGKGPKVFRDYPKPPRNSADLLIAVRDLELEDRPVFPDNPTQFQVHLAGTSESLAQLGEYLIALSKSRTADPEPYESLNDVRNADGGTVRLIVRRLNGPPKQSPRSGSYKSGVCR